MIIWINGPYGVGKSTLAEALCGKLKNSFLFDAEEVGNAVRDNMPERFYRETFEEFPMWHEFCVRLLKELDTVYDGDVLVPMTLKLLQSHEAIIRQLQREGVRVAHVMLEADRDTIHDRILQRGEEEGCWCMENIEACLTGQRDYPCDLRLDAADKSADGLAEDVLRFFGLK